MQRQLIHAQSNPAPSLSREENKRDRRERTRQKENNSFIGRSAGGHDTSKQQKRRSWLDPIAADVEPDHSAD